MGLGIKTAIKKVIHMTNEKVILPVPHIVDNFKLLDGKVALITGGSGGIGKAIAKSLCESGCRIILCGTDEIKLKNCIAEFQNHTLVRTMVINVTEFGRIVENLQKAVNIWGKIDIFVNSAGVHTEKVDFWSMTPDEYDRVMDINLKGTFFFCQAVGKYMKENGIRGRILLISSSRGSEPAWSPYGISKWGMKGLTEGLAKILLPYGIIVNAIAPGSTATSLIGVKEGDSIYSEENGMGRYIMPDEIAAFAKLLVSDSGNMIVGETIHISAGRGIVDIR